MGRKWCRTYFAQGAISGEVRRFTTQFHETWVQEVRIESLGVIREGADIAQEIGTEVAVTTDNIALTPPWRKYRLSCAPYVLQEDVLNK